MNFSVKENTVIFWVKKLMEKIVFTDYWKVLVLNFLVVGNTVFFWVKKLMERYLLVTEKLFFRSFRWWETQSFFIQKVGRKMIFIWSFLAFHDIPGLRKYGFSCCDFTYFLVIKKLMRGVFVARNFQVRALKNFWG